MKLGNFILLGEALTKTNSHLKFNNFQKCPANEHFSPKIGFSNNFYFSPNLVKVSSILFKDMFDVYNSEQSVPQLLGLLNTDTKIDMEPACLKIEKNLATVMNAEQQKIVHDMAKSLKLVHKTSVHHIRRLLTTFPSVKNGIDSKGICATLVSDTPLVTTFNRGDQRFYGVMLNPDSMVPVIAAHQDLYSECQYDKSRWKLKSDKDGRLSHYWNHRTLINAAPNGSLCHDMNISIKMVAKDIALNEGQHDFIEKGKILGLNEIVLLKNENHDKPLCHGIFVDLISNSMLMVLSRENFRPLLSLAKPISNERWMQSIQAINIHLVNDQIDDFLEAKKISLELNLPFLIRILNAENQPEFLTVDISMANSLSDIPEIHEIIHKHDDPFVDQLVDKLSKILGLDIPPMADWFSLPDYKNVAQLLKKTLLPE